MPGSPKKRERLVRNAVKRMQLEGEVQPAKAAGKVRVQYTPALGAEIASLIANGVPIDDSVLNGVVLAPGVATRIGIHPSTFYEWQSKHSEFAEAIARAREESAHRIADRMLALADAALAQPALANAIRVSTEILRWQAGVRNPAIYGERKRVEIAPSREFGEQLRKAQARVVEAEFLPELHGESEE